MKILLIIMLAVFISSILFCLDTNAVTQSKDIINGFSPSLIVSGTLSTPKKVSANSYEQSYGYLLSFGIMSASQDQKKNIINNVSILFSKDAFITKEDIAKDNKATITSIHLSNTDHLPIIISNNLLFMPYTGGSTGISKFSIPDEVFNKQKSTLTELEEENGDYQSSGCWKFGAQVALKDLIPSMKLLSVTYSYDLMTVEKAWMPWHSIINTIIFGIATGMLDSINQLSPNSHILGLLVMGLKVGITALWYNFDYKHHNWPFKDYEPLKYHRQSVSISSAF